MKRSRGGSSGVTLVELMFALAVVAVSLLGLMSLTLQATRDREDMRERSIAKEAAADKLEEIREQDWNDIVPLYGPPNDTFEVDGLSNLANVAGNKRGLGTIVLDTSNPDLYDIRITVAWDSTRGPAAYTLRSVYTR